MRGVVCQQVGRDIPKQFFSFGLTDTLLQRTVLRTTRLIPPSDITVVVDDAWGGEALTQLRGFPGVAILRQPVDRGTGTGVLLPLTSVLEADPSAVVLLTPADHGVRDELAYWRGILTAYQAVVTSEADVVLLGAFADAPRTDYGWIVSDRGGTGRLRRVTEFVEKPSREHALRLHRAGALWNTMVLVARGAALLALFQPVQARDAIVLRRAVSESPSRRQYALHRVYRRLARTDFSRDVLTPTRTLAALGWPRSVGWTDLGTPARMSDFLARTGVRRSREGRCAGRGMRTFARGDTRQLIGSEDRGRP